MSYSLMKCVALALLRHAGNAAGLGVLADVLIDCAPEVWRLWSGNGDEARRQKDLEAVLSLPPEGARAAAAAAVREVGAGLSAVRRQELQACLSELPALLRSRLNHAAPESTVLGKQEFVSMLSGGPTGPDDRPAVTLTAATGIYKGRKYVFHEREVFTLGKEGTCLIRFPKDENHRRLSRQHCLFEMAPPSASVRDLGSRNGTYVNKCLIGRRGKDEDREMGASLPLAAFELKDGDVVSGGGQHFRVTITAPPPTLSMTCPRCERRFEAGERGWSCGELLCDDCRASHGGAVDRLLRLVLPDKPALIEIEGYDVNKLLARGGQGAVYLAHRLSDRGRQVAIKTMLPEVPVTSESRKRFLREARLTAALDHENIIRQVESGYSRGLFYIALQYCPGGSAADLVARSGPLEPAKAVALILQALRGLDYAHRAVIPYPPEAGLPPKRGVVHRDFKPGNLLLAGDDGNWRAVVTDYGLAKAFDEASLTDITRTNAKAGTFAFMPRVQLTVGLRRVGFEVDVWAAAATLYFLLTGSAPRRFSKGADPIKVVMETKPVPIRERNKDVPPALAAEIDHALIDDPEIKIKAAAGLRDALVKVMPSAK